jgi:cytosine/adenosine deaminase-related metal-dependent hydrolase
MLAARQERSSIDDAAILRAAAQAIQEARATGTALVGDVTNTLATVSALADAGMPAHVFHELIGFGGVDVDEQVASARRAIDAVAGGAVADDAVAYDAVAYDAIAEGQDIRLSLAPHAPYSVSPALFAAIRRDLDAHAPTVSTVHLGESPEEVEFLKSGAGPWRTLLEDLGVWNDQWEAPQSSPVEYLAEMGLLTASMLAVHGVQFDGADLDRLRTLGVTLVSCPRSNRYVGVGSPPLEAFYAMDVEVAFGTDSLASVDDLNMFSELAEARRIAPKVPARTLLRSATLTGAGALGFGDQFGSIEPGKRAALIAVRVPEGVSDVEEYLVSGIQPSAIQWLMSTPNSQIPTST